MMNQLCVIGRIVRDPEITELDDGKKVSNITVAVQRSYKNSEGEYEADFIDVKLWNDVAERTADYCHKGDLVGVKGRLQTNTFETENGEKRKVTEVVAEKITFLASRSMNREETTVEKDAEQDIEV